MIETVPSLTLRPWSVAVTLRALALASGGADGLAAYGWFIGYLLANPAATQSAAATAWTAWSNANGNIIYSGQWLRWMIAHLPAGYSQDFAGLKSYVATKSLAAWMGEFTEYSDGYRVSGEVTGDFRGVTVELAGQTVFSGCRWNSSTVLVENGYGYTHHNRDDDE